ncbi:hypothetical protein GW915_11150 [bacterium]|nr:hypothetical protein [bacterium]
MMDQLQRDTWLGAEDFRKDGFKDWPGLWYVLSKEKGHNDLVTFTQLDLSDGARKSYHCSHAWADGVGAFRVLLRKLKINASMKLKPAIQTRPTRLTKLFSAVRAFLDAFAKSDLEWKSFQENPSLYRRSEHRYYYAVFSRQDTMDLKDRAAQKMLSLNAIILALVNKEVSCSLIQSGTSLRWMFPVNMRPWVQLSNESANCSSAIELSLRPNSLAHDIHLQCKEKLKKQEHWGVWSLLNIGKWIGEKGMRKLSQKRSASVLNVGCFSGMGEWCEASSSPSEMVWLVTPPGTRNYPVSVSTMIWNARLSLTVKIHPSICAEEELVQELCKSIFESVAPSRKPLSFGSYTVLKNRLVRPAGFEPTTT